MLSGIVKVIKDNRKFIFFLETGLYMTLFSDDEISRFIDLAILFLAPGVIVPVYFLTFFKSLPIFCIIDFFLLPKYLLYTIKELFLICTIGCSSSFTAFA